jgi:hypothetical protein
MGLTKNRVSLIIPDAVVDTVWYILSYFLAMAIEYIKGRVEYGR